MAEVRNEVRNEVRKEYIERNALVENLNRFAPECYNALLNQLITKQPAADVVEVRRGEWCLVEYEYLVCDRCGHWHYTGCDSTSEAKEKLKNGEIPNFCPNCGADMRGETNEKM